MLFIKLRPPKEATENGVKMVKVLHGAGTRERREGTRERGEMRRGAGYHSKWIELANKSNAAGVDCESMNSTPGQAGCGSNWTRSRSRSCCGKCSCGANLLTLINGENRKCSLWTLNFCRATQYTKGRGGGERGQLCCLLPLCGISQDACNSGSCVPPVEALRHTKEMNTLPRLGAGRGSCGRWRKLQIDSSKMENENGKGKPRKGKERLFQTQQHASRNRCEPQRSKAKRNQIEANRNRSQTAAEWGAETGAWQSGAGNLCREIEILNLPLHLSRISIWPRVPETDMIQATEWGGGPGKTKGVKHKWERGRVGVEERRARNMGLNSRSCQTFDLTWHSGISKQVTK